MPDTQRNILFSITYFDKARHGVDPVTINLFPDSRNENLYRAKQGGERYLSVLPFALQSSSEAILGKKPRADTLQMKIDLYVDWRQARKERNKDKHVSYSLMSKIDESTKESFKSNLYSDVTALFDKFWTVILNGKEPTRTSIGTFFGKKFEPDGNIEIFSTVNESVSGKELVSKKPASIFPLLSWGFNYDEKNPNSSYQLIVNSTYRKLCKEIWLQCFEEYKEDASDPDLIDLWAKWTLEYFCISGKIPKECIAWLIKNYKLHMKVMRLAFENLRPEMKDCVEKLKKESSMLRGMEVAGVFYPVAIDPYTTDEWPPSEIRHYFEDNAMPNELKLELDFSGESLNIDEFSKELKASDYPLESIKKDQDVFRYIGSEIKYSSPKGLADSEDVIDPTLTLAVKLVHSKYSVGKVIKEGWGHKFKNLSKIGSNFANIATKTLYIYEDPKDGKWHVLFHQRSTDVAEYKNAWDVSSAGHFSVVDDKETHEDGTSQNRIFSCVVRELREETGVSIRDEKQFDDELIKYYGVIKNSCIGSVDFIAVIRGNVVFVKPNRKMKEAEDYATIVFTPEKVVEFLISHTYQVPTLMHCLYYGLESINVGWGIIMLHLLEKKVKEGGVEFDFRPHRD